MYESHFSTQVPTCFHFGDKVTHVSKAGMMNYSTTSEVNNQCDVSNEKVCSITSNNTINQNSTDNLSRMGRLKDRYDEWEKVTSNPFILGVIRDGYKLLFKEVPEQTELKNNKSARIIHNL